MCRRSIHRAARYVVCGRTCVVHTFVCAITSPNTFTHTICVHNPPPSPQGGQKHKIHQPQRTVDTFWKHFVDIKMKRPPPSTYTAVFGSRICVSFVCFWYIMVMNLLNLCSIYSERCGAADEIASSTGSAPSGVGACLVGKSGIWGWWSWFVVCRSELCEHEHDSDETTPIARSMNDQTCV